MKFQRIDHGDYIEEIYDPTSSQHDDPSWPTLEPAALHGLGGNVVFWLAPNTEADHAALLLQFLVSFGNAVGRKPYSLIEGTKRFANLYTVLAGATAKARKATAADRIRQLFETADPDWVQKCIRGGISSGEGIIWAIRDPIFGMKKGALECTDPGVEDKRLLLDEREYQQALTVMVRPGNIVSGIIRDAWDGRDRLESVTKNSPAKVTAPMISIVGHVTIEELRESLDRTAMANGYANRFLFACVRRGQLLPHGGDTASNQQALKELCPKITEALAKARTFEQIGMTPAAMKRWEKIYYTLSVDQPGLLGAIMARAEAQVRRLAMVYALTDGVEKVDVVHLNAAEALWKFSAASAMHIFGDTVGDPLADEIMGALRANPITGMTRSELLLMFKNSQRTHTISAVLLRLQRLGLVRSEQSATGGRPVEKWFAV